MTSYKQLRILGIDPGSSVAGFSCIESKRDHPLTSADYLFVGGGVIRLNEKDEHCRRIFDLHSKVDELLREFRPDICVIERAFCGINISSALKLGEARGAVISAILRHDILMAQLTPAEIKKTICGHGRATKVEIAEYLRISFKFDRQNLPFDVTDALAIALSFGVKGLHNLSFRVKVRPPALSSEATGEFICRNLEPFNQC